MRSTFSGAGERNWYAPDLYYPVIFGNYNPIGAALAAVLFGGLDMLQIQLQTAGIRGPEPAHHLFPYVAVIVVLSVWGSTRMPSAVGESYRSED